jgi:hypothetical protein
MVMSSLPERRGAAEQRFASVFSHLGLITAYTQRRGVSDPDAIAPQTSWRSRGDASRTSPSMTRDHG